jgi:hypothetical protein
MPSAIHFYRQEAAAPVDVRFHTLDRLLTGESSDRSGSNQPVTDQSEFFGIPRGLGRATATTSATFLPHCEQRIRGAAAQVGILAVGKDQGGSAAFDPSGTALHHGRSEGRRARNPALIEDRAVTGFQDNSLCLTRGVHIVP